MQRHSANAQAIAERLPGAARWRPSTTRACRTTPATSWPSGRCAASAAWSRSRSAAGEAAARQGRRVDAAVPAGRVARRRRVAGELPDEMTHASVRGTELAVPPNIIRLSVGIEDVDDLIADLDQPRPALTPGQRWPIRPPGGNTGGHGEQTLSTGRRWAGPQSRDASGLIGFLTGPVGFTTHALYEADGAVAHAELLWPRAGWSWSPPGPDRACGHGSRAAPS